MTASKTRDIQKSGMLLADEWKLFPTDSRNWELCEFRQPQDTHGNPKDGEPSWYRCGLFYQYNTIDQAMLYVLDVLAKQGATDQMLALASAMRQWQEGVERIEGMVDAWRRG